MASYAGIGTSSSTLQVLSGDLPLNTVYEVLQKHGVELVRDLQKSAAAHVASGALEESIRFDIQINGDRYRFQILIADYWQFVNDGRKPGKMPPLKGILRWLNDKRLSVTLKGKGVRRRGGAGKVAVATDLQKTKSLAFLIRRKIGRYGTKRTAFVDRVVHRARLEALKKDLAKALKKDVVIEIKKIVNTRK